MSNIEIGLEQRDKLMSSKSVKKIRECLKTRNLAWVYIVRLNEFVVDEMTIIIYKPRVEIPKEVLGCCSVT